ncbi:NAD(P)-binding protein [Peniophora sp. CONT]|nr:NAD(P)-binding protein [Peniophora sp. CONT]
MAARPIFVVAGLGNGSGTGAATARLFAKNGYRVALIARSSSGETEKFAQELNDAGGEAAPFPVESYSFQEVTDAFGRVKQRWPDADLRVALYNASFGAFKGFLDVTEDDINTGLETSLKGAYAFSRQAVLQMKEQSIDDNGKRGTILFTGATASIRGNTMTSGFSPGKSGLRALAQSLNKEFGKSNIHVRQTIIDGVISTDKTRAHYPLARDNPNNPDILLKPEAIAHAYLYLTNQDRSAWSFELDLRPAHEKW